MDRLKTYDWGAALKKVTDKAKQYVLNLSDLELKVENATSPTESWGPHGSDMNEIAEESFNYESYRQIMGVLARRLQERDENWRGCYKALLLLEFLVKHGPIKVVHDISSSASVLDRLTSFEYKDANGKDFGVNVRVRAKELLQLVNDPDRVREERNKAKSNKTKYTGASASQMRSGFGGSSSGFSGGSGLGGGGSSSFGRSGGALGGAGSSSFGRAGRMTSEDAEEDYHYISKRATATDGGDADPVSATRARIESLKMSSKSEAEERAGAEGDQHRKRLTDVKVNPKIAASLGLKVAAPAPAAAAPPRPAAQQQGDLLGGLTAPAPAAAAPAADLLDAFAAPVPAAPAPVAPTAAGGWDAFAAPAPATAKAPGGDSWDAFGTAAPVPAAAPAVAPALDLFGDLSVPAPAAPAATVSPAAAAAAPAFDPFALPGAPAATSAAASGPGPAPGTGKPAPSRPLPEDMFSDLTGINKPMEPMGSRRGLHMEPPPLGAAAAAGPAPGGFAPAFPAPGAAPGMPGVQPSAPGGAAQQSGAKDPFADLLGL